MILDAINPYHYLIVLVAIAIVYWIYKSGWGGVITPDMVLVTETSCETLSNHPFEVGLL